MTAYRVSFAIMGIFLFVVWLSAALREDQDNSFKDYMRTQIWELSREKTAAKLGHQIVVNREAVKALEPGDIVEFGECRYTHLYAVSFWRNGTVGLKMVGMPAWVELDPECDGQMNPNMLWNLYKRGTSEWKFACIRLTLEGVLASEDPSSVITQARSDFPEVPDTRSCF